MNTFLFFRYENRMLNFFFSYLVNEYKYWKQSTNTAKIVLLSPSQIGDIFLVLAITLINFCKVSQSFSVLSSFNSSQWRCVFKKMFNREIIFYSKRIGTVKHMWISGFYRYEHIYTCRRQGFLKHSWKKIMQLLWKFVTFFGMFFEYL